ncbi:helix-turn-helix domain-containing protein [Sporohalobacter salinus]|uniref:helix-turn-helix domain-containing protein n=1 Tax=Sporohalobacter salinus TaxID=1494606 RepID=UPI0019608272|nr:helix-turn-helix transcriptional regulator [Sporohalobacter salinus]MBM7622994.1 transcriptional regulator with XRE-family HTH domain [Sporohalobacter salinus]
MSFSERLKKLRKEYGLRQKDVAKDLNLTPSAIGFYEQGKRNPDYKILSELADYFEVSVDYLLGRTNERRLYSEKSQTQTKEANMVKETKANTLNSLQKQNNLSPNREDLIMLTKQAKKLSPEAVKALIKFITAIEED